MTSTRPAPFLIATATAPIARFLCAHGAGGAMDSPFLETFAKLLQARNIETLRFEFAYMGGPSRRRKKAPAAESRDARSRVPVDSR
ncbi:alpha/beta family hydrolase, partial [Vibrio parahaemolyticus]